MIGVAVPAHNEQATLGACLASVLCAAHDRALHDEAVCVCVVLDACDDGSAAIVEGQRAAFAAAGVVLD